MIGFSDLFSKVGTSLRLNPTIRMLILNMFILKIIYSLALVLRIDIQGQYFTNL